MTVTVSPSLAPPRITVTQADPPRLRVSLAQQGPSGPRGFSTITTTAVGVAVAAWEHVEVTAAGQTITLPASPEEADEVAVGVGAFADTIVARNGQLIAGAAENLTIDIANTIAQVRFVGGAVGWRVLR